MENLAMQKTPSRKPIATTFPVTRKTVDEGYLLLRERLTSHISRSSYQEYFFGDSKRLPKYPSDDENLIS